MTSIRNPLALLTLTWCMLANAAEDCALGERYQALAADAVSEYQPEKAYRLLNNAVEACSRYEYWQELGELASQFGEQQYNERAAVAFVNAYDLAGSPSEQARAAGKYAELLYHTGDPQRALEYVSYARETDPGVDWIESLTQEIDARVQRADMTDIKRGLEDAIFRPLVLRRESVPETSSGSGSGGRQRDERAVASDPGQRKIRYFPVHFIVGSIEIEPESRAKLEELAAYLKQVEFEENRFVFVGHADVRGTDAENLDLSRRRAVAVSELVVGYAPDLESRITTKGMGERQPIRSGTTEEDHRINRRLEVLIE